MRLTGATTAFALGALVASCTSTTSTADAEPTTTPVPLVAADAEADTATTSPVTSPPPTTAADTSTSGPAISSPAPSTAPPSTAPPTTVPPPDPPPPNASFEGLQLGLDPVADVEAPTALAWQPSDGSLFIATQDGRILRIAPEGLVLAGDLSAETFELLPGSERGLLGLAFDPRDGRLFVNLTDVADDTRVFSFEMKDGTIDMTSRREVLRIEQPGVGHNGGRLVFDDAGNLYIGSGDGGGSNGRDAQDPTKLLGAILRITPRLDGDGYDIPPDNPFADGVHDRPEVLARGLRNPWGFSIDDETGDLWIGDVGNDQREEIDVIRGGVGGQNFGWYYFEGTNQRYSEVPDGLVPPVYDYPRSDGVGVMGGHVYRGAAIPALRGAYLFADLGGVVWAIGADGVTRLAIEPITGIVGWGEGPDDELYLLSIYEGVFRVVAR